MADRPEVDGHRELREAEADASRARSELERALRFTESLLTAIPTPVFFKDAEGRYIGCNRAFSEVMGVTAEQIRGKTVHECWPSDHAAVYHEHDLELLRNPGLQVYEFKVRDRHGEERPVIYAKNVFYDESDRVAGLVGAFIDITGRVRAEEELRRRLAFEQVVLDISTSFVGRRPDEVDEGIDDGLRTLGEFIGVDRSYIFSFRGANTVMDNTNEWCRAGIEPHSHRLRGLRIVDYPSVAEAVMRGQPVHVPRVADLPADSTERLEYEHEGIQSLVLVPTVCEGRVNGFLGFDSVRREWAWTDDDVALLRVAAEIFANVIERRRVALRLQEVQRLESIGRLAAGVAHDFNNMLTPILGYSELLLAEVDDTGEPHAWVVQIASAARRSRELVRQLLAFSRKQLLDLRPVDLCEIVRGFEPLLRRTIREDVELKVVAPGCSCRIRADVGQIEQIVMNLAVNAQDAMAGVGTLRIETGLTDVDAAFAADHAEASPGRYALLTVSDTGCGMDERTKAHLFEPFFTTKPRGEGTGLGLATVYGIVKQHNGFIALHSEPGRGTTFKIFFRAIEEPAQPRSSEEDRSALRLDRGTTVMVVEDDDTVRGLVGALLARAGCTVLSAGSGRECLELLARHEGQLDLVLTDVVMPDVNGRELYDEVVERFPAWRAKVLYMSGYADDVIAHHGVIDEGVSFIQKPFSIERLLAKVREVLGR